MITAAFKPSQVVLRAPVPLCGTMGRVEVEFVAALIVMTCRHLGDAWQPVTQEHMDAAIDGLDRDGVTPFLTLMAIGADPDSSRKRARTASAFASRSTATATAAIRRSGRPTCACASSRW